MCMLELVALALTAIALVPSGAHFFELPHKMSLSEPDYFVTQGIYAGWSWFAVPILAAIIANMVLFVMQRRRDPGVARAALLSASLIVLSLVVFFIFVFPSNQATANWTVVPDDWQALRARWEYGHAFNFALNFLALLLTGRALQGRKGR